MSLKLIYHFQSSKNQDETFRPASYRVVYFFSDQGFLDMAELKELSKSIPDANHDELTFLNLDDLRAFSQRVCQELEEQEVRLISVQDYNIGLDGAKDLNGLREVFNKFGDLVVNESPTKKKGFLNKFFT